MNSIWDKQVSNLPPTSSIWRKGRHFFRRSTFRAGVFFSALCNFRPLDRSDGSSCVCCPSCSSNSFLKRYHLLLRLSMSSFPLLSYLFPNAPRDCTHHLPPINSSTFNPPSFRSTTSPPFRETQRGGQSGAEENSGPKAAMKRQAKTSVLKVIEDPRRRRPSTESPQSLVVKRAMRRKRS